MVIVTKCAHGGEAALLPADDFEAVVTREREQSLAALRTNYIDLYLLHRDNTTVPVGRILERMNEEIAGDYARAIGASNWSYARLDQASAYAHEHGLVDFAVVSNNLSLAVPAEPFYPRLVSTPPEGELWHAQRGVLLLSWSSQARGFFTGRYSGADVAPDGFSQRMVQVYGSAENAERLRRAQELGQRKGGSTAVQVALAWLLYKPFPLVPLVGPHTEEELLSCLAATRIELSEEECKWLNLG
jgi:aryl-alcohol dehydrogenase-like predicted oxidoreductase